MDYYDLEPHGLGLPHSYVTLTCCDIFHNQAMLWKCGYLCSWDCAPYVQQQGACAEEKIPAFKFVRDILYIMQEFSQMRLIASTLKQILS